MPSLHLLALLSVLALSSTASASAAGDKSKDSRTLKRTDAKRWQRLSDIAKSAIKVSAKRFVTERNQNLAIPVEVDILMLGFERNGHMHYQLDSAELHELLSARYTEHVLCPVMRDTGVQASICAQVSTVDLPVRNNEEVLVHLENVLSEHMHHVGQHTIYHGTSEETVVPMYEIDAAKVEREIQTILAAAYDAEGLNSPEAVHDSGSPAVEHRLAVVLLNPSKQRMNPRMPHAEGRSAWLQTDLLGDWQAGQWNASKVADAEAGYAYRYTYDGRGVGEAWISQFNFVVVDLSAGPTHFGPLVSLSGHMAPTSVPRLVPMMEALARNVEEEHQITLHNSLAHKALEAHHKLLVGQLSATVSSAIDHIMAPDLLLGRLEVADTLLLSLVVLHDHEDFNMLDGTGVQQPGVEQELDVAAIQTAMEALMPRDTTCVMMPTESRLHGVPEVLMSLSRARSTWSDAVMLESPHMGLHHTQHSKIDIKVLMQELRQFLPMLTGDAWNSTNTQGVKPEGHLASSIFHEGVRHLPVLVLSLKTVPPGLMFENGELVAADHDMVVVLQVIKAVVGAPAPPKVARPQPGDLHPELEEAAEWLRLYSGHHVDGQPLDLDGARGVTAHIIAGMAMALGGLAPPWERVDPEQLSSNQPPAVLQDWRWAVGCVPWGPYANCTTVSGVLRAAARRNQLLSHVEMALQAVQRRLDEIDQLVAEVYQGPWPGLSGMVAEVKTSRGFGRPSSDNLTLEESIKHRYWLDILASRSSVYNQTFTPKVVAKLEQGLAEVQKHLEMLSWVLFTQSWDTARDHVSKLLRATDAFTALVDEDIRACRQVASCCTVSHGTPQIINTFMVITFLVLLVLFASAAFIALSTKKVYKPPRQRSAPQRQGSGSYASGTAGLYTIHSGGFVPGRASSGGPYGAAVPGGVGGMYVPAGGYGGSGGGTSNAFASASSYGAIGSSGPIAAYSSGSASGAWGGVGGVHHVSGGAGVVGGTGQSAVFRPAVTSLYSGPSGSGGVVPAVPRSDGGSAAWGQQQG